MILIVPHLLPHALRSTLKKEDESQFQNPSFDREERL